MSPDAQHLADRLRSALRFHSRQPRHRGLEGRAHDLPTSPAGGPGEEFAQRLRRAIDA